MKEGFRNVVYAVFLFLTFVFTIFSARVSADSSQISGVEAYTWYRGCTPTALSMIYNYYGSHGFPSLYSEPSSFHWDGPGDWIIDWLWNVPYAPRQLVDEFADIYGFPASGGSEPQYGAWPNDNNAISRVAANHGYDFTFEYDYGHNYETFKREIDQDRPVYIAYESIVGNHSIVGFGYDFDDPPPPPSPSGYTWSDSNSSGGPNYQWVNIAGVGTEIDLGDDAYIRVPLGFSFPFYDRESTRVKISSNGYLTFGGDGTDYTNDPIPDTTNPDDYIAPFWDDLNPRSGGHIYYYRDIRNNRFIVEYYMVPRYNSPGSQYTFQVILYPDGTIVYQYRNMVNGSRTASATIGIENRGGTEGLQVSYNRSYVQNHLAVKIERHGSSSLNLSYNSSSTHKIMVYNTWDRSSHILIAENETIYRWGLISATPPSGYTWSDSNSSGGPNYQWVNIAGVGTEIDLGDDAYIRVPLGFSFPFYDRESTRVKISSNGYLTFGGDGTDYTNDPIPDTTNPDDYIAPFWDDLNPRSGGHIYYYRDIRNNRFIVEYYMVPRYNSPGSQYTFQVILYPDGTIVYQYRNMVNGSRTASATIGIENRGGTEGLQVSYNRSYVQNHLAVKIERHGSSSLNSTAAPLSPIIYPNPRYLNEGQVVTVANLPLDADVEIHIYDLGGNLIRTLGESEANIEGGSKTVVWDCKNNNGELVARDVYVFFIASGTEKRTAKIAIMK